MQYTIQFQFIYKYMLYILVYVRSLQVALLVEAGCADTCQYRFKTHLLHCTVNTSKAAKDVGIMSLD